MKIKTKRGARRIRNQRVVTRRFVVTDYTGCPYITAGKRYPVIGERGDILTLKDIVNGGSDIMESKRYRYHLNGVGTWRYAVI